jgi:hypothetical protein
MVASRELLSGVPGRGGRGERKEVMRWMCGLGSTDCEDGDR